MAFRERLELVVDVVTGTSSSSFRKLKDDLNEAEGGFGKLKVAGSNAWDALKANAGAAALGVGTALAAFGAKAIGAFEETALGAGKLRDSLGLTAEEASRFQEVAGDLGIGVGALESTIGRMNKTVATTPEKLDAIGAAIARNRDGTVNVQETFLNVVGALNKIPDATKRAAAAQQIFGRGWQNIAELVKMGADGVRESLASVESQKVFNDDEIAKGKKFRDMLDELKGVAESLTIELGSSLIGPVTKGAGAVQLLAAAVELVSGNAEEASKNLDSAKDKLGGLNLPDEELEKLGLATDEMVAIADGADAIAESTQNMADQVVGSIGHAKQSVVDFAEKAGASYYETEKSSAALATQTEALAAVTEVAAKQADRQREANERLADQLNGTVDAARDLADAQVEAENTLGDWAETIADWDKNVKDASGDQRKLNDLVSAGRDSAIKNADALAEVADKQAQANGQTIKASDKLDIWNRNMLSAAGAAKGPLKDAILDYIATTNNIPKEKLTAIKAALDKGDIAGAEAALRDVSRSRQSLITAQTAGVAAAEQTLSNLARVRNATIAVTTRGGGAGALSGARAGGGPVAASKAYMVGEDGPEVFVPNKSGTIVPNGGTGTPVAVGAGVNVTLAVTINQATDPNAVVRQINDYVRRNGPGGLRRALGIA